MWLLQVTHSQELLVLLLQQQQDNQELLREELPEEKELLLLLHHHHLEEELAEEEELEEVLQGHSVPPGNMLTFLLMVHTLDGCPTSLLAEEEEPCNLK